MTQLADLNRALDAQRLVVTARELGLEASTLMSGPTTAPSSEPAMLSGPAVLSRLCAEGSPVWPYIHGHFRIASDELPGVVPMHTDTLRELSRRAGLHHGWGL